MPAGYHINGDEGLITVRVEGPVDLIDLLETGKRLLADPGFDPDLPQLLDFRGMSLTMAKPAQKPFARFIVDECGAAIHASIAVVVDADLDDEVCAGIYWLTCAVPQAEMFDDYDLALKWLIRNEFANGEPALVEASVQNPDTPGDRAHHSPE